MTLVVLPRRPRAVPVLTGDSASARVVAEDVRLAAVRTQEASDEADAGAIGASWSGPASVRAEHAMTRLARDLDDAVAALWCGVTALDEYAEALVGLELERERLVEQRSLIDVELDELERTVPLMGPDQVVGAQVRANLLGVRVVAHEGEVRRWWGEVVVAEDRAIAALAAVDTAAEAREHAASRSEAVDRARAGLVASGVLPGETAGMGAEELAVWLEGHPEVAAVLARATPMSGEGPVGELAALVSASASSAGSLVFGGAGAVLAGAAAGGAAGVRDRARALSAEDARMLALLYPGVVGSLGGVPFAYRADANRVLVVDALARERAWQEELADRRLDADGVEEWQKSQRRIELYESVLEEDRSILYLDPARVPGTDGAMVELHGRIDEETRNVVVSVPGTGSELSKFQGFSERVEGFYLQSEDDNPGSLAMIAWLGGDFPDEVFVDAFDPGYAERLAPELAAFSHELRQEIDHASGRVDPTIRPAITVDGHSYGGTVVGLAETHGLDADRVVHVESAGMGKGVFAPDDLPASQQGVDRYVMTAPGDPITVAQATGRHGADPDEFDGITRLHTGYYRNDDGSRAGVILGGDAHSGVYDEHSDSWEQLYRVYTGGVVETYRTPLYLPSATIKAFTGGVVEQFVSLSGVAGFADDGAQVDIP